jgi:hypothetical protein
MDERTLAVLLGLVFLAGGMLVIAAAALIEGTEAGRRLWDGLLRRVRGW